MRRQPSLARVGAVILAALSSTLAFGVIAPARTLAEDQLDQIIGVVGQPFNILGPQNGRFRLKVSPSVAVTRGGRIEFLLHRRVASRGPFRAIADGQVEAGVVDSVSEVLSRVPRDNSGLLTPSVVFRTEGSTAASLTMRFDGVYPLTIRITNHQGRVVASTMTFLNRRDPQSLPLAVQTTALLRIGSTPSFGTDGLADISEMTRAIVRRSTTFLATTPANVTVTVEPELIAALASVVEPGDEQLFRDLRDQLRRRSITVTTFARMNPSVMAARGLGAEFIAQLRLGEAVLDRYLQGVPIRRSTWVALDPLDSAGASLLQKAGIRQVLLTSGAQVNLGSNKPIDVISAIRDRRADPLPVVAADPLLSESVSTSSAFPEQVGRRIAAEALVTRDDLVAGGTDPNTIRIVLATPTGSLYENSALVAAARVMATTPGFVSTDMSVPQTVTDADPEVVPGPPMDAPRDRLTASLAAARTELNAVSSMFPDGDPQRDVLQYLYGLSASASPEEPPRYLRAVRTLMRTTLDSVTVTTPGSINLSSRRGVIRFQVRNNTDFELTVRVRVSSVKLRIPKPATKVTLVPGGTTEVSFSGSTLTNGRFPISIRVQTPEGNLDVVPSATITARVSAVAGFGQLASATLLLLILAWWWSHRRSRRGIYGEAADGDTVSPQ